MCSCCLVYHLSFPNPTSLVCGLENDIGGIGDKIIGSRRHNLGGGTVEAMMMVKLNRDLLSHDLAKAQSYKTTWKTRSPPGTQEWRRASWQEAVALLMIQATMKEIC